MHISASAATDAEPTVSASNCMNWRNRPGPGFSLRNTVPDAIAAVGFWQFVEIFRDIAGERRGQIIAQRQPAFVIVLERKDAFVRPVLIRQKLAERLGELDDRRLDRLEPIEFVGLLDEGEHFFGRGDLGRRPVGETARQLRAGGWRRRSFCRSLRPKAFLNPVCLFRGGTDAVTV